MAADGLVSAVVQSVLGTLSSAAFQEIGLLWGFKDDLNSLEGTFRTIQLVLQDAEVKQRKSEAIQNWLRELKNAAYDAENILDLIATEGLRRRVDSERGMQRRLKSFISLRNPLLFRFKMVHQMRNMKGKLDAIAGERLKFQLGEGVVGSQFGVTLESRHTSSLVNELEVVGRNEEKEMMIEQLLDSSCDQEDLSVYAIWGMGGLGKTTLAQMVYNDERTERHFELRLWVCVSDDFSVRRLVRAIIESLEGGPCNISELDPLQHHLQERLRGRKFLLVLDDVWNENYNLWDELKQVLRCGSKGSVLMLTTRIEKVALMMTTITTHRIAYLSEDDSWSLFRRRAFPTLEGEENLVAIGKAIVKKCGGVPLAIKALGSVMRTKSHESEWLAVKESEIWHLSEDENGILPALRLSYDNLLPQLRQCFAYCCIFPKDCNMEKNELIQLWMANGYLSSDVHTDMVLTGHLIFKELVWRSFFQDVDIDFRGNTICKMHDLMHDLALSIMRNETCILERGKELKYPKTLRHLSFNTSSSWEVLGKKSKLKLPISGSLNSIIAHDGLVEGFPFVLSKQQYLKALDMRYFSIKKLPNVVCKLEHLRYLVLSCYNIKRLPESFTRLLNLQTLKITASGELRELPKDLKVMKNLWFLDIEKYHSLVCTPPGLGELTFLRELSIFIVGQDASHQIDQLKELNLGGKLSIQGLDNVRNLEDAKSANLVTKTRLSSLSLSWTKGNKNRSAQNFEEVLQGLQPHRNLEEMCIKSYCGARFPNWMSSPAFKKLKKITLHDCPTCEYLPDLGRMPYLTDLNLFKMDSVKCLDAEAYGNGESSFPTLTSLIICSMANFELWTAMDSIESFPCLKRLCIQGCPKLTRLPNLLSLKSLEIHGCSPAILRSIASLPSLTLLMLYSFEEFDVFPRGFLQNHNALEKLQIGSLPIRSLPNVLDNLVALKTLSLSNIEFLPDGLEYLNSLERLEFSSCSDLGSFPAAILEGLSSLRSLSFQNCKKLKPLSGPLGQTPSQLHDLLLHGLPELQHLPESIQLLSALRELILYNCEGISSLPNWLGSLELLSEIKIWYCQNLKSLPDGFRNLKSMRKLDIERCPKLENRCKKPNGADWPKISHIPIIYINRKAIQCLDQ